MTKHKLKGFTVVELIVVIVVIALLTTIISVAYRETQKNARNEKRKTDVIVLMGALDEYYADKGGYPSATCSDGPGGTNECWKNEIWLKLKNEGYLKTVSTPDTKLSASGYNLGDNGNANYGWIRGSATAYGIYVPMEGDESCKIGKNIEDSWWGTSLKSCKF